MQLRLLLPIVTVFLLDLGLPRQASSQIRCDILRTSATAYAGRCVRGSRTFALLVLHPPQGGPTGRWHGTRARIFGEDGDSTHDRVDWQAFAPEFVDVGGDSLFSQCWCKVTRAYVDRDGLHFEADPEREGPPTPTDLRVLTMVRRYFPDSTYWNRHSDRSRGVAYCPANPRTRTLYCALVEATTAARGEFYLFTPANAAVRAAIGAASPRRYQHPLDGFNNDSLVDFGTFRRVLADAERRVREALRGAGDGPNPQRQPPNP